MLSIQ